jgi:hypothetical protein
MTSTMNRLLLSALILLAPAASFAAESRPAVDRWGVFEVAFEGPREGNSFVDVQRLRHRAEQE